MTNYTYRFFSRFDGSELCKITSTTSGVAAVVANAVSSGYSFAGANLANVDFSARDLTGGNFYEADLSNTLLIRATVTNCNFEQANLSGADFSSATATNANFQGAYKEGWTSY